MRACSQPVATATTANPRVTQNSVVPRVLWVCTESSCFSSGLLLRKLLPVRKAATIAPVASRASATIGQRARSRHDGTDT